MRIFLGRSGRDFAPLALVFLLAFAGGCREKTETVYQGYAEGDFVRVASPFAGRLEQLVVSRGTTVRDGDLLFVLEQEAESAAVDEASARVAEAEKRLADLRKGQRPTEIAAIRARLEAAEATLDRSRQEFQRRRELFAQRMISEEELDRSRAEVRRDEAAVGEIRAELQTARLGARPDEIRAAEAAVAAAAAQLAQARWALERKGVFSTRGGPVFDTFFEPGEFVPAGYPVVSLLPPENIRILFYVPEPVAGTLRVGQAVTATFDGAPHPFRAAIAFISPAVEYTPPVIFSRETRAKLVIRVEARPDPAEAPAFHPGQPVDIRLEAPHG